jgi:energy-coupling factor transport system permease protein
MDDLLFAPGEGLLYRLDPRAKLLFVLTLFACLALVSSTTALLAALLILHALSAFSASTRRRLGALWKGLVPLVATVTLLGTLRWRDAPALVHVGPITVTALSLWTAIGLGARISALTLGFSLFLWTTESGDAVAGLTRLGLPFELGFPLIMAMQYVATFKRSFQQILEAQQSRGLTLPRGNPIRVARAYIPVLVPLLIHALRSVDSLSLALQSRGFGGGSTRTSRRSLRMRRRDWLFLGGAWCTMIALGLA